MTQNDFLLPLRKAKLKWGKETIRPQRLPSGCDYVYQLFSIPISVPDYTFRRISNTLYRLCCCGNFLMILDVSFTVTFTTVNEHPALKKAGWYYYREMKEQEKERHWHRWTEADRQRVGQTNRSTTNLLQTHLWNCTQLAILGNLYLDIYKRTYSTTPFPPRNT